jgi:hypothetical protein
MVFKKYKSSIVSYIDRRLFRKTAAIISRSDYYTTVFPYEYKNKVKSKFKTCLTVSRTSVNLS